MKEKIVLYGGGEQGRVALDTLQEAGFAIIGVVDQRQPENLPLRWLGGEEKALASYSQSLWHVAIGSNRVRDDILKRISPRLKQAPLSLVHPKASVSSKATLGAGCFIAAGAVVAVEARLGPGCLINHGASVDHDAVLERCVHVAPGAHLAGRVRVGARSLIGLGASVIDGLKIGKDVILGAGAVAIENIEDAVTAVGVPARKIKG
jgi:sugar O-acyltransferase (sialic acid O-acetyltransferase NeuD family)